MVDGPAETKTAPVVLISFNRPDVTRRTLERIRDVAPAELLLIADGPRPGNDADVANCAAVRRELESIDWPCEVKRRYSDVNLGPEANIEGGLDWVFDHVEEAIILEDDCLPNADFFRFCSELLERYRTADDVWMISGRAPPVPAETFGGSSYAFAAVGPIWGWATWRRCWSEHRSGSARGARADLAGARLQRRAARRYFEDVARASDEVGFGWDSFWSLSLIRERALAAIPATNLIEVIGFGPDATHTATPIPQRDLESIQWPLSHPPERRVNAEIEDAFERVLTAYNGRLARVVSRALGDGRLRQVVRSAVGVWRDRRARVG
jgi:hypothetical protein